MDTLIKTRGELSEIEIKKIKTFLINIFSDIPEYPQRVYSQPNLKTIILFTKNDNLIAHAAIFERETTVEGKRYLIGGVGDVAVSEDKRKLGLGSQIMSKVNDVLKKDGYQFGLLFCDPVLHNFYSKSGWIKKTGRVYYHSDEKLQHESTSYILPLKLQENDLDKILNEPFDIGEGTF